MAPVTSSQRLLEAARETNVSARFGRMEVAASAVSPAARAEFLRRRASWGGEIRVLDVELAGLSIDQERRRAVVEVNVAWTRMGESTLRATRVTQVWREGDSGWQLTRERRAEGDTGLFGEAVQVLTPSHDDVHFATRRLSPVIEPDE
jgi:hypothetical protein